MHSLWCLVLLSPIKCHGECVVSVFAAVGYLLHYLFDEEYSFKSADRHRIRYHTIDKLILKNVSFILYLHIIRRDIMQMLGSFHNISNMSEIIRFRVISEILIVTHLCMWQRLACLRKCHIRHRSS